MLLKIMLQQSVSCISCSHPLQLSYLPLNLEQKICRRSKSTINTGTPMIVDTLPQQPLSWLRAQVTKHKEIIIPHMGTNLKQKKS